MDTNERLDLNLLPTLETLLAEQNVTRAAERLHLSQPAVSAQLNRLRELFDDPLLIPAQRGMTPTAKAQTLLTPLRQALDQVRGMLAEHRHFDPATVQLTVNIACTDYLQTAVIQPLAVTLRQRAPGLRIALHHLEPARLAEQMASGAVDLALMSPEHGPDTLRSRHLFDEHYVLISRHRHPGLRNGPTLQQVARLEHVIVSLQGGGFRSPVDDGLAALGYTRNVAMSAASFLAVPAVVAQSDWIALVPERLVRPHAQEVSKAAARDAHTIDVRPCPLPVPGFGVNLMWHERTHAHSGHRWMREQILSFEADTVRKVRKTRQHKL
ncbi:MAG: LysR family transcriptional regulator [Lautropia sp.]|nr:LysR family transcriptional regulator [Lautropia sp.]